MFRSGGYRDCAGVSFRRVDPWLRGHSLQFGTVGKLGCGLKARPPKRQEEAPCLLWMGLSDGRAQGGYRTCTGISPQRPENAEKLIVESPANLRTLSVSAVETSLLQHSPN
jgi:hypothetical protein